MRILIVEDEVRLLKANMDFFADQGYDVSGAGTLRTARQMLQNEPPDLILLDVMLPDGSGFDFCREIRELSNAPVIFLTARGDLKDEEQGFALGGDDYLIKPYDINRLGVRVAAMLRRTTEAGAARVEIPPLSVDPVSGICVLDGSKITLTQIELRLLHYLMKNSNRLIHRDKVYEDVWGLPPFDNVQTVVEHVYRLRKKLGMNLPDSWFNISCEGKAYMFNKIRY